MIKLIKNWGEEATISKNNEELKIFGKKILEGFLKSDEKLAKAIIESEEIKEVNSKIEDLNTKYAFLNLLKMFNHTQSTIEIVNEREFWLEEASNYIVNLNDDKLKEDSELRDLKDTFANFGELHFEKSLESFKELRSISINLLFNNLNGYLLPLLEEQDRKFEIQKKEIEKQNSRIKKSEKNLLETKKKIEKAEKKLKNTENQTLRNLTGFFFVFTLIASNITVMFKASENLNIFHFVALIFIINSILVFAVMTIFRVISEEREKYNRTLWYAIIGMIIGIFILGYGAYLSGYGAISERMLDKRINTKIEEVNIELDNLDTKIKSLENENKILKEELEKESIKQD